MPATQLTIRSGGLRPSELIVELAGHGVQLNDYARTLFGSSAFETSIAPREVRLAFVSVLDLGLPRGGTFDRILDAAAGLDLQPCDLEVAPHLRLAFLDQPVGPYLTVASRPLRADLPNGLYLRCLDDGLWLRGYRADADVVYEPGFTDFVFQLSDDRAGVSGD